LTDKQNSSQRNCDIPNIRKPTKHTLCLKIDSNHNSWKG
jgi:hypothetical protein